MTLDGFVPFNFDEGMPYVSVTRNGITFNKGVVMKMQYPKYVVFLINAQNKQIAIQACDVETKNAAAFCSEEKKNSKVLSIRWNSKDLLNTISSVTGWNLAKSSYRVDGSLLFEDHAMIFDLNKAEELK